MRLNLPQDDLKSIVSFGDYVSRTRSKVELPILRWDPGRLFQSCGARSRNPSCGARSRNSSCGALVVAILFVGLVVAILLVGLS